MQPKERALGRGREGLVKGLASEGKLCSPAASDGKAASVYLEPSCHQMQAADAHTVLPRSSGKSFLEQFLA